MLLNRCALLALIMLFGNLAYASETRLPNIVLIVADDLGYAE